MHISPALPKFCWSIPAGKGELPFPSALKQRIKLKAIKFSSADPKPVLGRVFRSPWAGVQPQVWRKSWDMMGNPRTAPVPELSPSPDKSSSAHKECHWGDNHLHSLLLTLQWHFLYQEWAPQQGICTWLRDKLAFCTACCTYRTEVLGGLITQLTQRLWR